ncbi:NAD(P)H-dependent flavin oxidoreductase [Pseudahrensia aquimaris]|uniref:NAD(P)H-dependent flavin oxidoreductase n=1 Tax=Pseudahrensia aquimaris TaxID=744461 RepID=A0ABW3FH35_9HYPH
MKPLSTRLTEFFNIDHPILSAPMALAAGGRLASAVTRAGGLGFIGGGYGDADWLTNEFAQAGNTAVGCGFITWSLTQKPELLEQVLDRKPQALFLSFGDPKPFATAISDAGVPLICQVQSLRDACHAVDCGAKVIIAQGAEAGGHGEKRATMTIVPEVADMLARSAPDTLLVAAGGIADGRGLAASLMLGADGVLVGSRLWASEEALVHPNMLQAAIKATGDDTIRSSVMDLARLLKWPNRYTARVLKNPFTERWHDDLEGLMADQSAQAEMWGKAWQEGNVEIANTFVGEGTGMIKDVRPAADIIEEMVSQAVTCLRRFSAV